MIHSVGGMVAALGDSTAVMVGLEASVTGDDIDGVVSDGAFMNKALGVSTGEAAGEASPFISEDVGVITVEAAGEATGVTGADFGSPSGLDLGDSAAVMVGLEVGETGDGIDGVVSDCVIA